MEGTRRKCNVITGQKIDYVASTVITKEMKMNEDDKEEFVAKRAACLGAETKSLCPHIREVRLVPGDRDL
jgi:hypothetical protein